MFDFLYQYINAQMAVPLMRASRRMPAVLGTSLRGLILLSSRAHGKADKYSLFKDLASKGFGGLWRRSGNLQGFYCWKTEFRCRWHNFATCFDRVGQKMDKKNPDTQVPGLIHTNEEGGGDIVTCCKNFR
jgi:hypothetical protein